MKTKKNHNFRKVLVLYGGTSQERDISIKTAQNIIEILISLKYDVIKFDLKDDLMSLLDFIKNNKPDVIFNCLHGTIGEDGVIQGILEFLKIPFTSSSLLSSSLCMSKIHTNFILNSLNLKTPKTFYFVNEQMPLESPLNFPFIIKPNSEGSSFGIFKIENAKQWLLHRKNWKYKDILIQEFIKGKEINVAVINGKMLGTVEIIPENGIYDFDAKYNSNKTIYNTPALMDQDLYQEFERISALIFKTFNCNGLIRFDTFLKDKDIYINEINTQPGFTKTSLCAKIANANGISSCELAEIVLNSAITF